MARARDAERCAPSRITRPIPALRHVYNAAARPTAPTATPQPTSSASSWFAGAASLADAGAIRSPSPLAQRPPPAITITHGSRGAVGTGVRQLADAFDVAAAPTTAPPSATNIRPELAGWGVGDVLGSVRAKIEESVAQFNSEAAKCCTDEAREHERAELHTLVRKVAGGPDADAALGAPPAVRPVGMSGAPFAALWDDAPIHIHEPLRAAIIAIGDSAEDLAIAAEVPAPTDAPGASDPGAASALVEAELRVLSRSALAALQVADLSESTGKFHESQ